MNKEEDNSLIQSQEPKGNNGTFFYESSTNPKLTSQMLTLGHLKIYLRLRFDSYKLAGVKAGISGNRVKQIVNGFYIPENPELIKQISIGWGIDAIVLTQLFDRYRGKK